MSLLDVAEPDVYAFTSDNEPNAEDLAFDYVNRAHESAHDIFEKESLVSSQTSFTRNPDREVDLPQALARPN